MSQVPTMSKRFALKRFLGLTDEEIAENERLWAEENGKAKVQETDASSELRSAGVSQAGISGDMGATADLAQPAAPGEMPDAEMGAASPVGGASPVGSPAPA